MFGKKEDPKVLALTEQLGHAQAHIGQLQGWVNQLRGAGAAALEADLRTLRDVVQNTAAEETAAREAVEEAQKELSRVREELVETREQAILQEVGVYESAIPSRTHSRTRMPSPC